MSKDFSLVANLKLNSKQFSNNMKNAQKSSKKFGGDFKRNMGGVKTDLMSLNGSLSDLPKIFNAATTATGGFTKGLKGVKAALISTGVGAIIVALGTAVGALTTYFKGTEEGQIAFKSVMNKITAITGPIMSLFGDLGKAIFDAFNNPKQAMQDIGNFIKNDIAVRLGGLGEIFRGLRDVGVNSFRGIGLAIQSMWKDNGAEIVENNKKLKESYIDLGNGMKHAVLGSAPDKIFEKVNGQIVQNIKNVDKLNAAEAKLIRLQRKGKLEIAKLELLVADNRTKIADKTNYTAEQRLKLSKDAIQAQKQITEFQQEELRLTTLIATLKAEQGDNTIADNDELVDLEVQKLTLQTAQANKLKEMVSEQQSINNEANKEVTIRQRLADITSQPQLTKLNTVSATSVNVTANADTSKLDDMSGFLDANTDRTKKFNKELADSQNLWKQLGSNIQESDLLMNSFGSAINGITKAFEGMFTGAESGFKGMVTAMLSGISQIVNALFAQAIAGLLSKEVSSKGIIGLGTAAVGLGVLTGLWKSKVPEFAQGGLVYGDTLARVGEYSNARSNPEVIAPLNKLKSLITPTETSNGEVRFVIEGSELVGVINNYNRRMSKFS